MPYPNHLTLTPDGIHVEDSRGTYVLGYVHRLTKNDTIRVFPSYRGFSTLILNGNIEIPRIKFVTVKWPEDAKDNIPFINGEKNLRIAYYFTSESEEE